MKRINSRIVALCGVAIVLGAAGIHGIKAQQAPSVKRNIVLKQDMTIPGREAVMAWVEIPPAAERADTPTLPRCSGSFKRAL